jgi:hypothetical protein
MACTGLPLHCHCEHQQDVKQSLFLPLFMRLLRHRACPEFIERFLAMTLEAILLQVHTLLAAGLLIRLNKRLCIVKLLFIKYYQWQRRSLE